MIPDLATLGLFCVAALALLVVPGPAVLYIVAQSIDGGRRAGLYSTLGVHLGSVVHVAAAAVGLSAILVSSATAFSVVKYAGAAYLVYLGLRQLLARRATVPLDVDRRRSPRELLTRGVVVNVLNPKTALFFLAFLPQFVDVSAGQVGLQIAFLGVVFIVVGLLSDGAYALLAGTAAEWLRRSSAFAHVQRFVSGGVFVGLGVATALSGTRERA